jgi:uncharacterized protein (DUF433 family)
MNWKDHIISDKNILNGKPVIKNTRLSVEFLLGRLADGWSEEMLLENYPSLSKERMQAVYSFALENMNDVMLIAWQKN